jgi:flagellar hook-associated protein 1 FlgK
VSVSSIIDSAAMGLRATQAALDVVSQNVANAGSVGYTRRVLNTSEIVSGNRGTGVSATGVQRTLETLLQKQLRLETAGAAYTGVLSTAHNAIDAAFDQTAGAASLSSLVNTFSGNLQALAGAPSAYQLRKDVVSAASDLAGSLNGLTGQVQTLRQETEEALGRDVSTANDLLKQIASISATMVSTPANAASPALQDQRDGLIDKLSSLMDLQVTPGATGSVRITTTGGLQLFDGQTPVTLAFDVHYPISAESAYSTNPATRSVGTITAIDALGNKTDVLASGMIRSGSIAGNLELRDKILPEAQTQLDALAAGLASALSDKVVSGTVATIPAPPAGQSGFDLDLTGMQNGRSVSLAYTDAAGIRQTVDFVRVDNATEAALVAPSSGTGRTVAIDFSSATPVATQIGNALGAAGLTVSSPAAGQLRVTGNSSGNPAVTALSKTVTVTDVQTGEAQLPLFVDGSGQAAYTGSLSGIPQLTGFAGRIAVNSKIASDPGLLVKFDSTTLEGDTTRPALLNASLVGRSQGFTGAAGIGASSGYTGTVADFAQRVIAMQAANANSAANLDEGQRTVLNGVLGRYSEQAGVNIDTELTQLIQLQTAYSANARVLTAAKDLVDMLLRVVQ